MPVSIVRRQTLGVLGAAAGLLPLRAALANDAQEAASIVDKARVTFNDVMAVKEFDSLRAGFKQARGILIFPQILKAGFFLGGSGGTGVLLVRHGSDWSDPAFYTMGSVSFGLQFGGQAAEVLILINKQAGIDRLMTSSLKLGGDVGVAAGPVGAGQAANVQADFVSYAKAQGAFVGFSAEGSVLDVRNTLNHAFYGKQVTPTDIVVKRSVSNKRADALRAALRR